LRSAATVLVLLGAAGGVARADPPPPKAAPPLVSTGEKEVAQKQAMALHDEAWALYEEGHYRAAIEKLEAALRIDPDGKELVYNLGLLHEKLADVKQAEAYYRRYLEMETDPKSRSRTQAALHRLEGMEKELTPPPLPPPPASAPAPPPPPPPPRPVRPWVIATGSAAGVALLLGSIFGLSALSKNPGRGATTGPGVSIGDLQAAARDAHDDAIVADASFLIMLAAAGTATFLYLSTPRAPAADGPRRGGPASTSVAMAPGLLQVSF
jgi:tetratricopeptide (TPR) repeat protein